MFLSVLKSIAHLVVQIGDVNLAIATVEFKVHEYE